MEARSHPGARPLDSPRRERASPAAPAVAALGGALIVVVAGVVAQIEAGFATQAGSPWLLGEEDSAVNAYSTLMLGACAAVAAGIGSQTRRADRRASLWWLGIALVFVYLAFDEGLELHERTIVPIREGLGTGGPLYFAWVLPALGAVALCAGLFGRFVLELRRPVRELMLLGAAMFVAAAIGLEMVEGVLHDSLQVTDGGAFVAAILVEESLELLAVVALLFALLVERARVRCKR